MKRKILILSIFAFIIPNACSGKVTYDLAEPGIIAESGDLKIPTRVFQAYFNAMKRSGLPERKDARAALFLVFADNYLGAEFRRNQGDKMDPLIPAEIEKVYFETLAHYISDKKPEALYNAYVKEIILPEVAAMRGLFNDKAEAAYTNVPLLREKADKVIVAVYGNKGEKKLTFSALFDAAPQAGKLHLFTAPDKESIRDMVHTQLRAKFLRDFVLAASEAEKLEYAALKRLVGNSILSRNFRYTMGMENANPHADNTVIKERAGSVSFSRIKEYYAANKDRYKEVQTIDCRHIKLKNYEQAINLRDKIEHGADMVEYVKKYSLADDKTAAEPGLIKGIKNDPDLHKRPRLETLCMIVKEGQVDLVRDGDVFEIVKAEKRVDGYPPLDDTTHLKEDIAREIAALDLKKEFDAKKSKILKKVDIKINKSELEKVK